MIQLATQLRHRDELRWTADAYEQSQRTRVQAGERIRAILQGRDQATTLDDGDGKPAETPNVDHLLEEIRKGKSEGPVRFLTQTYRRSWEGEQEAERNLKELLSTHPVWPWLKHIKGVGPVLAGRLLARLDPVRAQTPSAFWAYCGLATVPGIEYKCATCGYIVAHPVRFKVTGAHLRLGSRRQCDGALEINRGPDDGARVAQPKPARGESSAYDRDAKKICYLIAVSFLRTRSPYADWYHETKNRLGRERPGWAPARIHLTSMRRIEKLFLSHLWLVWRERLGLPTTDPYPQQMLGHTCYIDPWELIGSKTGADHELLSGRVLRVERALSTADEAQGRRSILNQAWLGE
jgi:hypothetical protein